MNMRPLMHPSLARTYCDRRQVELEAEARNLRIAANRPNKVERFFIKRREGKVTWIETVLVRRCA